ncbi:hypothetical protein P8452_02415 [Trifolium repens]|nr:hypothetical protein P8452_02415 [Trifolium repens]
MGFISYWFSLVVSLIGSSSPEPRSLQFPLVIESLAPAEARSTPPLRPYVPPRTVLVSFWFDSAWRFFLTPFPSNPTPPSPPPPPRQPESNESPKFYKTDILGLPHYPSDATYTSFEVGELLERIRREVEEI